MNNSAFEHWDDDRLLDLAHGLVDPRAAAVAFAHLRRCAACENRFKQVAMDREEILAAPRPRLVDGRLFVAGPRSTSSSAANDIMRWGWRRSLLAATTAAVAASVVIGFCIPRMRVNVRESAAVSIPRHVLAAGQQFVHQRAANVTATSTLSAARDAYDRGDFKTAVQLLQASEQPLNRAWDLDPMRRLYLASACIQIGDGETARDALADQNVRLWPQPSRREAQWVLYVALRQTGDVRGAGALLDELVVERNAVGDLARAERARLAPR